MVLEISAFMLKSNKCSESRVETLKIFYFEIICLSSLREQIFVCEDIIDIFKLFQSYQGVWSRFCLSVRLYVCMCETKFCGTSKMSCITAIRLKILKENFNIYLNLYKILSLSYIFHYIWSSPEIMCIAFIVLLLKNSKLFYTLLLFCLYIEILAFSSLFKYLITIKYSESRVEKLQIF